MSHPICKCGHYRDKHYNKQEECFYEYDHGAGISCDCQGFEVLKSQPKTEKSFTIEDANVALQMVLDHMKETRGWSNHKPTNAKELGKYIIDFIETGKTK